MGEKSRSGWTVEICLSDCEQDRELMCQKCRSKSLYKSPRKEKPYAEHQDPEH